MKSTDVLKTRIHSEGHLFVGAGIALSAVLFWLFGPVGWVGVLATLFCLYFFRDPERIVPTEQNILVSPADGTVASIIEASGPKELEMEGETFTRISVFLSVFDVHVNRLPLSGEIAALRYVPGEFLDAADENASELNERQYVQIKDEAGDTFVVSQVAGLVARRILCDLSVGQQGNRGDRFGLIRFGSRTDIYLPSGYEAIVLEGQKMIGGETVIARKKLG